MYKIKKTETGNTIVEATIVYPITILVFFVLFYASLFLCQRANLQANLEDALIYYKNVGTDTFVGVNGAENIFAEDDPLTAEGSTFKLTRTMNPYRHIATMVVRFAQDMLGMDTVDSAKFSAFFKRMSGHMFFDDGDNITVTVEEKQYGYYKELVATATQKVSAPIRIEIVGAKSTMDITVYAKVAVVDGDDLIRDIDFAADIMQDTAFGQKVMDGVQKLGDKYQELKEKLGMVE